MTVKLVAFDVDGVLTDGSIVYSASGEELKTFHAHDGYGLKLLQQAGFVVAAISGKDSAPLRKRLSDLGIDHAVLGCKDKVAALIDLSAGFGWTVKDCAFMGDDLVDYLVMQQAGMSLAPANAVQDILELADHITQKSGGQGAVREAAEYLLGLKGISALSLIGTVETKQ